MTQTIKPITDLDPVEAPLQSGDKLLVLVGGAVPPRLADVDDLPVPDAPAVELSTLESPLSADVNLTSSNTWYDGPSVTLTPGTWLVFGNVTQRRNTTTAEVVYSRLTDKTNHFASTQAYHPSATGAGVTLALTAVITVVSATEVFIQLATSAGSSGSQMLASLSSNGSGNNATKITAVKIA